MGYRAWIAIACALGAQVICGVHANAPVRFERTVSSPDGDVSTTVRTLVKGKGAKVSASATASSVNSDGKGSSTGFTFSADALSSGIDTPASPGDENAPNEAIDEPTGSVELKRNDLKSISTLTNACGCQVGPDIVTADIRKISDTWMAQGDAMSTHKLSNMIWAWGQVWIVICIAAVVPLSVTAKACCMRSGNQLVLRLGGRFQSLTPAFCICSLWIMTLLVRFPASRCRVHALQRWPVASRCRLRWPCTPETALVWQW